MILDWIRTVPFTRTALCLLIAGAGACANPAQNLSIGSGTSAAVPRAPSQAANPVPIAEDASAQSASLAGPIVAADTTGNQAPVDRVPEADMMLDALVTLGLTDQHERRFAPGEFKGQTVLLNFIYTSCTSSCPLQTHQLLQVYKAIPRDRLAHIRFISVSVDPGHDTPVQLKNYAEAMGAEVTHWSFLTGRAEDIASLTRRLRPFDPAQSNATAAEHTTDLYLFDRNGQPMRRYHGSPVDVPRLTREIQQLDQLRALEVHARALASSTEP